MRPLHPHKCKPEGSKFFCDTWVPIAITYIMNFGFQATIMVFRTSSVWYLYSNTYGLYYKTLIALGEIKKSKKLDFFSLGEVFMGIEMGLGGDSMQKIFWQYDTPYCLRCMNSENLSLCIQKNLIFFKNMFCYFLNWICNKCKKYCLLCVQWGLAYLLLIGSAESVTTQLTLLKGTPKLFFIITYFETMIISKNGFTGNDF